MSTFSGAVGKSCKDCPSFLTPDKTPSKFKKSIGAPMCGRYGHVLGKPNGTNASQDKLARYFAEKCDAFGQPLPALPIREDHFVTLADPDARDTSRRPTDKMEFCRSCAQCKNFVPDDVVSDELGWVAGLCAARGKLVMPTKLTGEAKNCEYRWFGPVRRSTDGLHILPEYDDAFSLSVDPVKAYFKSKDNFVDPTDYPTDRDVLSKEKESGIRAWRKVRDPEGTGNEVFLPIYEVSFFAEGEQKKIPRTGNDEHPELYVDHNGAVYKLAVYWTELDETPALWGEAGTGKTELYRHLAWLMCLPFERISITANTEIDELAGSTQYSQELGTYFRYGRIPLAWQKPCVMCIDEPNVGQNEVWQFIRPMTDNSKQLALDMNKGEILSRHTDCYLGMAMNPAWDPKNVGAYVISDADARRLMHVQMNLPPAKLEREIITNRVSLDGWEIDTPRLDAIMKIAKDIRALCNDGTLPCSWGIANQIKVARASRWFDLLTAYRMAMADFLEPQASEMLLDQVKAHIE